MKTEIMISLVFWGLGDMLLICSMLLNRRRIQRLKRGYKIEPIDSEPKADAKYLLRLGGLFVVIGWILQIYFYLKDLLK